MNKTIIQNNMKRYVIFFILLFFIKGQLLAQVKISGQVVDESGIPLPGVNVIIKGTTQGTVTDLDGNYTIENVPDDGILVFSFISKETQEIAVGGRNIINVTMQEEAQKMDEVVIVGYGAVKRANLLGAVGSISAEKIEDIPTQNLSTLLEGRIAGLKVGQSSGSPGASTNVKIRVTSSWNAEDPIFVIDGIVYEDQERFDILDPSEVESISVLKDASAAVYGARASGGVIVVKTKRGQEGKPKIKYSSTFGYTDATEFPEMLSAYEHAQFVNQGLKEFGDYGGSVPPALYFTDNELDTFKYIDNNWLDEAWKQASLTKHNLSVSGGSDKVRYFGNAAYFLQNGNFENVYASKYSLRLGVDADITKDLTVSFTMSNDNSLKKEPLNAADQQIQNMKGTFKALLEMPRFVPPYITTDEGEEFPVYVSSFQNDHPLELFRVNSHKASTTSNSSVSASVKYKVPFVKGLSLNFSYNYDKGADFSKQYRVGYYLYRFKTIEGSNHILTNERVGDPYYKNNESRMYESAESNKNYQLNTGANYNRKFGLHDINALLVYEQSESESNNIIASREGLLVEDYYSIVAFNNENDNTNENFTNGARQSLIGRLNYSLGDKYLLESSFRYEGSEKFTKGNRWGFFPSVALGWRISEEKFFKDNVNFIEHLKIRASSGLLGNDKVLTRQWEYRYNIESAEDVYLGGSSAVTTIAPKNEGVVYANATWEKTLSNNIGFDLVMFQHFNLAYEYFYKHTWDVLSNRKSTFPATAGIEAKISDNYGIMDAWGHEFDLGFNNKIGNDFGYSISGNFAFTRSKVIKKRQNPAVIGSWADEIGKMPNGEVGYTHTGIIRSQEEADELIAQGITLWGQDPEPGMMMYKDVGGPDYSEEPDGVIDGNDKRIIEPYASAPYNYGFALGCSYKKFKINANFSGSFGAKVLMEKAVFQLNKSDQTDEELLTELQRNRLYFWGDHWTEDNADAEFPRIFNNMAYENSTFWLRDGHILRLTTINLSYSLPSNLINRLKLSQVYLGLSARNIWTIINPYEYKDPSVPSFNSYPLTRTYNLSLNITF
ncbi:SusC/RagA family TonB-linked outer membrane protein [Bacteroidota bacterium]